MNNDYPQIGFSNGKSVKPKRKSIIRYINLKLAAMGLPTIADNGEFNEVAKGLINNYQERLRVMSNYLPPVDQRFQDFVDKNFADVKLNGKLQLPSGVFELDRYGLARELSLPVDKNKYKSEFTESARVKQGVLHNPKNDRRTTKGSFHVSEGGLPVTKDKITIPKHVFGNMMIAAFKNPAKHLELPFTSSQKDKAKTHVGLLLRPLVSPEVPGKIAEKRLETRFIAPGNFVANLDFVESIFGNGGDPFLPENDAMLDSEHFSGQSGLIILAPHLPFLTKKSLGVPHKSEATKLQLEQGVYYEKDNELYNDGGAFKAVFRTEEGLTIALIGDNYFGYCKKEVKSQISFASNLSGLSEEEHGGGALAFPCYNLGDIFNPRYRSNGKYSFNEMKKLLGKSYVAQSEGYGIDANFPNLVYIPDDTEFNLQTQKWSFKKGSQTVDMPLLPEKKYIHSSGYKIWMEKHPGAPSWRLIGSVPEGTFCHKPCTVSGGGKSEISKALTDMIIYKNFYVQDLEKDLEQVEKLLSKDYQVRFKPEYRPKTKSRALLSADRSLGSVIKLFTPNEEEYTSDYNKWLGSIPDHIRSIVFVIKRFYRPEWGDDWKNHFKVDTLDGQPGHELIHENRKLVSSYLRVGMNEHKLWQTYKLRLDFIPSKKVQMEDDITATITIPNDWAKNLDKASANRSSIKLSENCEFRLFQRPDEAIHRGFDKQTEMDLSEDSVFTCNYDAVPSEAAKEMLKDTLGFDLYTEPMKQTIREAAEMEKDEYFVCTTEPRTLENGMRSPNMRYLQNRPDLVRPEETYMAEMGTRLHRKVKVGDPLYRPVNAILVGRRNNPADHVKGIRPLAVYNPIHYQELPEAFMDFVSSLTGKSPSTTGAGSEGALTKGPFNSLRQTADLNNLLISCILGDYQIFSSAAGYVGHKFKIDHDVSLLIPEVWSRMTEQEREVSKLLDQKCLERIRDFDYKGKSVPASRLGFRINENFLHNYFGRIFSNPIKVFPKEMLKPELQNMDDYVDGIFNIVEAHKRIAQNYFDDGSVDEAIPPLKALLHIMVDGNYNGKTVDHKDIRSLFTKDYVLNSDWYAERLKHKQNRDIKNIEKMVAYLEDFSSKKGYGQKLKTLDVKGKKAYLEKELKKVNSSKYLKDLVGTIGADALGQSL